MKSPDQSDDALPLCHSVFHGKSADIPLGLLSKQDRSIAVSVDQGASEGIGYVGHGSDSKPLSPQARMCGPAQSGINFRTKPVPNRVSVWPLAFCSARPGRRAALGCRSLALQTVNSDQLRRATLLSLSINGASGDTGAMSGPASALPKAPTLAWLAQNVRVFSTECQRCGHKAEIPIEPLLRSYGTLPFPMAARGLQCASCGSWKLDICPS